MTGREEKHHRVRETHTHTHNTQKRGLSNNMAAEVGEISSVCERVGLLFQVE